MLTVHHLENSRSQRILWLLEELEVEYALKTYARDRKTSLAPPEMKTIHPLGKSPIVIDGDTVVVESGAIIEYVLDHYGEGRLRPAEGTPEFLRYRYWLHAAEGSVMPLLLMKLVFNKTTRAPVPFFIRPITGAVAAQVGKAYLDPALEGHLRYADQALADGPWFAGADLSGADIQMSFVVEGANARAGLGDRYPRLADFLARVRARPAWKRALERGGPYQLGAF